MTNIPAPKNRSIIPDMPSADDLLPFLRQIDKNRWYSNFGPLVNQFEQDFIKAMMRTHGDTHSYGCTSVGSGYQALNMGLRLLGINETSTVLVPSVTFPACGLVVENSGAKLLLSDVDQNSWTLTPEIARQAATHHKIDAVMPVSIYGMEVPAQEWDAFTEKTGIKVLIDAAAAIETQHYLKHGIVAHSMHALKPLGIGEGGLVITPNKEMAEKARQASNFGIKDKQNIMRGENSKMSEYHAAVGLAQMKRWDDIKKRRKKVANLYFKALKPEPRATAHPLLEKSIVTYLMVSLNEPIAQQVFEHMQAQDIPVHRTYLPPLYQHAHFQDTETLSQNGQKAAPEEMKGSEWMNAHVLGLPFHPFMDEIDVRYYVQSLTQTLNQL